MTFPRARLAVAASLFVAWLGYLLVLVLMSRHTVVLSRPQFLVAEMCAIAELTGEGEVPAETVTIQKVRWSLRAGADTLNGKKVRVANLHEAGAQGYQGPGSYILALNMQSRDKNLGEADWVVTPIPGSPGYGAAFMNVTMLAAGPDLQLEQAARLASEILGLDAAEARAKLDELALKPSVVLKRNVPRERAVEFSNRIAEATAKNGAGPDVSLTGNDVRIYPLTPATQEQLDELYQAR